MPGSTNVRYVYDGSFDGFLCCVYESVYEKEVPCAIATEYEAQPCLFVDKIITTDEAKALRVFSSFGVKIHPSIGELIQCVFLSCMEEKELAMLRYLLFAYKRGRAAAFMLGHPLLQPLLAAQRSLKGETHLLLGFIRFADVGGALVARITPKNYVLPFLQAHFCGRYANENFLIFDQTHHAALMYQNHEAQIVQLDALQTPLPDADELHYQALWKQFYKTIGIAARENPRCRMTHMPKRYWKNMLEMLDAI